MSNRVKLRHGVTVGQMLQRVGFAPVVSLLVRNASSGFSFVPILSPILVRIPLMIH